MPTTGNISDDTVVQVSEILSLYLHRFVTHITQSDKGGCHKICQSETLIVITFSSLLTVSFYTKCCIDNVATLIQSSTN